jgi:predicted dienelactone hydrolase
VQLWEAEDDRIAPNRWSAENVKANLPSPPELHLAPGADHFAFIAPCSTALAERMPDICRDPAEFERSAFHREFNAAVVGFFQKQLEPVGTGQ